MSYDGVDLERPSLSNGNVGRDTQGLDSSLDELPSLPSAFLPFIYAEMIDEPFKMLQEGSNVLGWKGVRALYEKLPNDLAVHGFSSTPAWRSSRKASIHRRPASSSQPNPHPLREPSMLG